MNKFIALSFLILGLSFYELSGGSDFEPEVRAIKQAPVIETALEEQEPDTPQIAETALAELPRLIPVPLLDVTVEDIEPDPIVEEIVEVIVEAEVEPIVEADMRLVSGSRVNMRAGPGTDYNVLDTLVQGSEVEVLKVDENGWAMLRVEATGAIGWMGERFLSER